MSSPKPATEGRIVHVHNPNVLSHCQPAIVVRAWGDGTGALNLLVFPDGANDRGSGPSDVPAGMQDRFALPWETSVQYSEDRLDGHLTWHWPEYVG